MTTPHHPILSGVSPDDLTAGLCGNNQRGTPFQGRHRRSRRPTTLPDIVTSWSVFVMLTKFSKIQLTNIILFNNYPPNRLLFI